MVCIAVFGRGSLGGQLSNPHLQQIKQDPSLLQAVYMVAGITPFVPISMGIQNFKFGRNVAEASFVCPEPFCCRLLPVYLSQLDHNVPQAILASPSFGNMQLGNLEVQAKNFVHRPATTSAQHLSHLYQPGGVGPQYEFAIFLTFGGGGPTFELLMIVNNTQWVCSIPRANAAKLCALIAHGFTVVAVGANYDIVDSVMGRWGTMGRATRDYRDNLVPAADLANYQFLCGPCNATKNQFGVPIDQDTHYA